MIKLLSLCLFLVSISYAQLDPCLEYQPGTNHCKNCSENYKFALINETTTLCASTDFEFCWLDHPFYLGDQAFNQSFQFLVTYTTEKQYCFNCTTYYTLPTGENLCYSGCPQLERHEDVLSININSQGIGCDVCAHQDYQMQTILDYSFIDLMVKTCSPNINDVACNQQEFYDHDLGKCVQCLDRYEKCASCNDKECLINIYQYYQGRRFFNYSSGDFDMDQLSFYLCGANQMSLSVGNGCWDNNLPNCLQGWLETQLELEVCIICDITYVTTFSPECPPKDRSQQEFTFFVKSGPDYNSTEDLNVKYLENDGETVQNPYYFISQPIQRVIYDGHKKLFFQNATIYLGKGDHFFFYCNLLSGTIPHSPGIVQYCDTYYDKFEQKKMGYDYFKFYFKPLYCSLAEELGFGGDQHFLEMCVEEGVDPNPTIYVNQAYAYFEIYNFARFENINFSGLNQLVQPVIEDTDLSVLPLKYCQLTREPNVGDQLLELEKIHYVDFHVNYKCIDKNYTGSTFPSGPDSSSTCERNKGSQMYQEQESTLTASGEPNHHHYFVKNQYYMENQVQPRRINTLFNLMALAEFMSYENSPPQLELVNCTFEYFLQSYESLISVQTKEFYSLEYGTNPERPMTNKPFEFMASYIGERGAKILIQNSSFKHSKFSKGLISYRKQSYIQSDTFGFGNFSYYYMQQYPYVHDEGSYIVIENSHFYNLNSGFQNISALALYGGQDVMRTFSLKENTQQYQGYIHKGTVINVEDFGGYIEIINSTFEFNMHMIPSIYNGPQHVTQKKSYGDFEDSSQTKELKLAICDEVTKTDRYFLSHGIYETDDIDTFYNTFERLSTIYISRNRGPVVIKDSVFHSNIGTFGGAISINSQDWESGKDPYVVIKNNNFTKNMAYLSGNALYFRNSLKEPSETNVCGGLSLINNNFQDNVGGSHYSNGGAASISCYYVTSELLQDYRYTSTQTIEEEANYKEQMTEFEDPYTLEKEMIYKYSVNIENNTFKENLAGSKGTALHIKQISSIRISNCTFQENGPFLSSLSKDKSPYVKYLSKRSLAFTSNQDECQNEFEYVSNCMEDSLTNIQWSHVTGALYVQHCQQQLCLENKAVMNFYINDSVFDNNQIGYIMDQNFPQNLSSQIQIVGGVNNSIQNCFFKNGRGLYSTFLPEKLKNFFPQGYYEYQQGSLIQITLKAGYEISQEYQTIIYNCTFSENKHFQALGLGTEGQFFGSLIKIYSLNTNMSSLQIPILKVQHSQFKRNSFIGQNTQLIYSQNALVQIENSVFNDNGGMLQVEDQGDHTVDSSSYFQYDEYPNEFYQQFGVFYIEGIQRFPSTHSHYFYNNTFSRTFTVSSSILYLNFGRQYLHLSGNRYSNNIAQQGGIISADGQVFKNLIQIKSYLESQRVNVTILIENEHFENQISYEGIFSLILQQENLQLNLFIENSTFQDNFQYDSFSLLSFQNVGKVLVEECVFRIDKGPDEIENEFLSPVESTNNYSQAFMTMIFSEQRGIYFAGSKFLTANATSNKSPTLFFKTSLLPMSSEYFSYIEIIDCSFENFYSIQPGVLATLKQDSKLMINNFHHKHLIRNCSVQENGIIFIESSSFVAINLDLRECYSQKATALLYLTQKSSSQVYNSSFTSNRASTYGMAYITGSSDFLCDSCHFINNSVAVDSSVLYADNNPNGFITIRNSLFKLNNASSNLMSLVSTRTWIEDSLFEDNFATLINNGLTTINSNVTLKNCVVNYTDEDYINNNNFEVDTCFLNINFQSVLTIDSTLITHCRGGTAGILQASGHSSVFVKNNSRFLDNKSSIDGSGSSMYFSTTNEVVIEDSYFSGNGIIDLYILRAQATILNSTFELGQNQFIYAQASAISILNSTFQNSQNFQLYGQGLFCYCYSLRIENSLFQNLSAVKGGSLYLTSQAQDAEFVIKNSTFQRNFAQQGGVMYVQDAPSLTLYGNNFESNSAGLITPASQESSALIRKGFGGCIFFDCQNIKSKLWNNCSYSLTSGNTFVSNNASHDGGAIFKVSNQYLDDGTSTWNNNWAPYGVDVASYPSYLEVQFVTNNDYYGEVRSEEKVRENVIFERIVSGTEFAFVVFIKDQDGNDYYTDNESTATLKNPDAQTSILLNGNEVKATNGLFNFSSVTAITRPGSQVTLELEISNMQDFGNTIPFLTQPLLIVVNFRPCISGEQMLNFACQPCPAGTYLYDAPVENINCRDCPEDAECPGKNIVYPKLGFWRADNTSEDWISCPRDTSCLEGNQDMLTENCQVGYEGKVCGQCSSGYSKTGSFQCGKCPSKTGNIVKISIVSLCIAGVVAGLVFSTFTSTQRAKSGSSVYIKILASHLQIISAIANVKFDWPSYIESMYNSIVAISKVSEQILSIDCFLEDTNVSSTLGVYFTKLLLYGLLPLILAFADLLFWIIFACFRGSFKNFGQRFTATLVILLFLVHPTITQEMFQAFSCVKIGEAFYLRDDIQYECYRDQHLRFVIILIIPSIIIWCIGIPLFALMMLLKHKELILKEGAAVELNDQEQNKLKDFRVKYGFIINGFKTPLFFYEVVIQFRKVGLIMVTVILSVVSPEIQALLSFMILILSMFYQYVKQPFLTSQLNKMEILSLLVSTITLYSGLYFITGQHYSYYQSPVLQWIFLFLLIIPNLGFFIYWLYYIFLELVRGAHKRGPRFFCIITLGLANYDGFAKKYVNNSDKNLPVCEQVVFERADNSSPERDQSQSISVIANKKKSKAKGTESLRFLARPNQRKSVKFQGGSVSQSKRMLNVYSESDDPQENMDVGRPLEPVAILPEKLQEKKGKDRNLKKKGKKEKAGSSTMMGFVSPEEKLAFNKTKKKSHVNK